MPARQDTRSAAFQRMPFRVGRLYSRGALCPWLQGCSRFDARAGVYACSVDGNYVVRVSSGEAASDDSFLVLERSHVRGGRTCSHVAGAGSGSLMHLRAGDTILLRLVGTAPLPARPLAGPVRLAISLAMRMRCREPEGLLDEGEGEDEGGGRGASRKADAKRRRGGGAASPSSAPETGSDTEWSEGFSSDDDATRRERPPPKVRRLARAARAVSLDAPLQRAGPPMVL